MALASSVLSPLSQVIAFPSADSYGLIGISLLQVLLTATSFSSEKDFTKATPYSKFATLAAAEAHKVSGRAAMLIIYVPALIYAAVFTSINHQSLHPQALVACGLITAHFGKRTLETFFLHKYSNQVSLATSSFIGLYYTLTTALLTYLPIATTTALASTNTHYSKNCLVAGVALFTIGSLGNLYHHYLLAQLRSTTAVVASNSSKNNNKDNNKAYTIPSQGMFRFVTMPHYFFELIAWLGIAVVLQHSNAFLVFFSMCSYLAGRSVATTQWYKSKFDKDFPSDRKHLVPFIF